jgi:nucleotide-binding universal stress UspA family protein
MRLCALLEEPNLPAPRWQGDCSRFVAMNPPKTILVPTDFSEPAHAALEYALELASKLGATVHLLHAFELPPVGFPEGVTWVSAETATRIIEAVEKELAELVEKHKAKIQIHAYSEQADPRDAIPAVAKKIGADLIVMGTHGRRGIVRALMGSVAESVVRNSPVPVLTLRGETS